MMETIIAIGIVILAAAGVIYGAYRKATGKGGGCGCDSKACGNSRCEKLDMTKRGIRSE